MINPFEGKAVKFETAEQLEHLAELARGYGLQLQLSMNFANTALYFRHSKVYDFYSNFTEINGDGTNHTEIHYSDFIKGIEAVRNNTINGMIMDMEYKTTNIADPIARPSHYRKCNIEPIQIWRELSLNPFMSNVVKYLMRLGHKDAEQDELTKAIQYLNEEIKNVELGIMQFTPKDAKCSVSADVIAKELGMSPFIHVALHVVLNLQNIDNKINALNTAINAINFEMEGIKSNKLNVIGA